ncbi:MATE family efflux transporter [Thalassolituus marinus]|uniref:MATE family efflux transporter n=1 Tax=Thalassolituus marinus TaxID=671053 RepID=A0ABS7ZLK2_9GAMM|nr:MATE family efflux transporter [Thalassolituus marinus]MCA6062607.1 MATE family efflux transporter [Thalassolituus marinus]
MTFRNQELRALLKLTMPILATQLAQIGMGTIDTLMSGYVSTRDLAAVAIGTSLWLPTWLFLAGVLVALSPLAARLNASAKHDRLPVLLSSALWVGIVLGSIAGILLSLASLALTSIVDDPVTASIASHYTMAIAVGMPGAGIFLAYRFYAEALNEAGQVTRIMLSGLLLNVPANAVFVYGWFGLPELGGVGCGIGSSIIFAGMAFAMARNTRRKRLPADYPLWQYVAKPLYPQVREILKIGIPIGIAIFFEVTLFTVIALLLTGLGPSVVAGHQVALNISSLTFMIPLSVGMALTVRVGHWLGSGETALARRTAWLGIGLNLGVALFNATLMLLFASHLAGLYSPDPAVVKTAATLMIFAAIFQLSDAVQVGAAGALRGYHDTFAVMLITFVAYWVIGLGSGYWLAFYADTPYGAPGFWTGLILGLTAAAIALAIRLYRVSRRPQYE